MKRMVVVGWFILYPSLKSVFTHFSIWAIDVTLWPELSFAQIVVKKKTSHAFFVAHMCNDLDEWQRSRRIYLLSFSMGKHEI